MPVGRVQVAVFEMRAGGQDDVGVIHAVGHRDVAADDEQVGARQRLAHVILVGMHDQRIVVVDEQRLERRVEVRVEQQARNIEDVEGARARRRQVGARQAIGFGRVGVARGRDQSAARHAELAGQRRERGDRADAGAAVLVALEAVAPGDDCRLRLVIPPRERADVLGAHAADLRGAFRRIGARRFHEGLESEHVLIYEYVIERAEPLHFHRKRPGQHHVGARPYGEEQVRLVGDLDSSRIDHHELCAVALGGVDQPHQVQIAGGRVVAPDDDELGEAHLLERRARAIAEGAGVGLGADAAAHRAAVQERGAEAVEETQRHRIRGKHALRSRVVERQHRLRSVALDDAADLRVDGIERFVPGDAREFAAAPVADALERITQPVGAVDELRILLGDLGADRAVRDGIGARALHGEHLPVGHGDRQAAGVRAVERTDAGFIRAHGGAHDGNLSMRRRP